MEFTNTFEGGLNKDSNILLQPRGTYRDMNNGMLVSYDGNDYVIELPKGTKVSFTIPAIYNAVYTAKQALPTVIGYISFIDTLVVFSTNSTTGAYGEIGIVSFNKEGIGTYTPLYGHEALNFSIANQITGFTFEENDRIKRVYWTDNFNQPRVLNVNDPAFNLITSGNVINGQEYMVVGGVVNYNGTNYGPGLTAGNVFTATATTTYTVIDGSPKVYEYINYNLLSWYPDRINPDIDFNQHVPGSLYGGSKIYFVKLSNKALGIETSWSYGSFPINVYDIAAYGSYTMVQGTGAGGVLTNSNTGIELKISNIDTYFDTIQVAVAEYDQANNLLRTANIFTELEITGSTMLIQHLTEGGTTITANDLTTFPASIFKVKDITTNKNYNVIGNITEREELKEIDPTTATISDLTYYLPADYSPVYASMPMNAGLPSQFGNVTSGNLLVDGVYYVTDGVIQYGSDLYGTGYESTFQANTLLTYSTISGTPLVRACLRISKYAPLGTPTVNKYKVIVLNSDYYDYRGMASTQYMRQYWSQETYRFAVIPYDKKGDPMYARWIGDHQIQSLSNKGGPMKYNEVSNSSLAINGIRISGLKIPADDMAKISGFSIVRAPRDKQYYAQGLLFPTVGTVNSEFGIQQQPLCQLGLSQSFEDDLNYPNIHNWYSPDVLFDFYMPSAINNYIEGECFLNPIFIDYGEEDDLPYSYGGSGPGDNEYHSKFYAPSGSAPQTWKINRHNIVLPGGEITNYIVSGSFTVKYDNNVTWVIGSSFLAPDAKAVGCKTSLFDLQGDPFYSSPPGGSMGNYDNRYYAKKPLMNYKIPKTNLYGGQSPDALQKTIYISTGHYQRIDSTVLADTYDATTNSYIFNNIDVFGGDSFLGIFSLGKSLYDNPHYDPSFSYGIFFPVESNINHYLRQGLNIEQHGMHLSDNGVYFAKGANTNPELFAVNFAYTTEGTIAYPALPTTALSDKFPYRVRWAGAKTLGETIDSFRTFPQDQFRDLDGNKGQINNVRNRDGKVFFWQDHSIGYLPILERQIINGSIGEATQLGVSGVIDRFDNFNTYFGNQHKFGLIETEYGFAWFDFRRRAFLVMTVGGGIQEVSFIKGLRTFFNNPQQFYAQGLSSSSYELQNNDTPLLGIGISGVYDPNYKMTYMNFKWVEGEDEVPTLWKNLTVGYHHSRNVFAGFFDLKGAVWQNHNNWVIANKNIEDNEIKPNVDYLIGNNVTKNNVEYVCIKDFTTSDPIAANEEPDYVGSEYWVKANQSNETHLLFSTNNFSKFFGQTYNHDIELVVNPKVGLPFAVDNLRQKSSDVNYDIIECTTDDDNVAESTDNKWYRYIDKSWNSSVPLGSKGRLVDFYLKVKLTLKNYTNNPTNSRNLQKVFEFVTSVFRIKK